MNREQVQTKALEVISDKKRCGLGISMGVGKTRIAINHLKSNFNPFIKALVVIPKLSVKDSWMEELDKTNLVTLKEHLAFTTYLSLNKHNPNEYDIVYLDECHSLLLSHEPFLSTYNCKILGLTGTPPKRHGSEKYRMVQKYCPIVYKFSVDQATDNNILNDYKIIVHELQLNKLQTVKKNNKNGGHWYTSELKDYQYFSQRLEDAQTQKQKQFSAVMRMKAMMEYPTKESYVKGLLQNISDQVVIFANTQKQADRLCKYSYHSKNKQSEDNLQLFSDGRISQLSCVLQLNEGVTIPNLKQGIIMHAYGNERKTSQRIGRLLRLNPNETAICHILCYKDTVDAKWVKSALSTFDQDKIHYYNPLTD